MRSSPSFFAGICRRNSSSEFSARIPRIFATANNYQHAPRQTALTEINGTPTEVKGPYRNLPEPKTLEPGQPFECSTVDDNGTTVTQRERVLQVNRKAHVGKVHSDLAGFTWPCDQNGIPTICTEPDVLEDPVDPVGTSPQVHHIVPMKDKRSCPWGTNSTKNAAVISRKLNLHLSNDNPPADEVAQINKVLPYAP